MRLIAGVIAILALSCAPAWAKPAFVFIAATNNTMPLAQFDGGRLSGGIVKDLGDAIAARLQRKARFLDTPSKRVWEVLAKGEADAICYVLPEWAEGSFNWSRPFIPDGLAIVAHPSAPVLRSVKELAGKTVGTVVGYHYPVIDVLGKQFVRDDAASMEQNLNKVSAGQPLYAITERSALAYRLRINPAMKLRSEIVYTAFMAQCAISKRSTVPFGDIEQAISSLQADGGIEKILARYR